MELTYARPLGLCLLLSLSTITACSEGETSEPSSPPVENVVPSGPSTTEIAGINFPPSCSDGDGVRACLLPFPSNRLTVVDDSTPTGLRVSIPADAVPVNVDGVAMDVSDQNRADGFSPSSVIVFAADGVDLVSSGVPNVDDIGASMSPDAKVRLFEIESGERWPFWGELDAQAGLVTIRPARLLAEGRTYRVEVDGLVDTQGQPLTTAVDEWEFTVASSESTAGRLLDMLDSAYERIGEGAPDFSVDSVVTDGGVRVIDGTFEIPNFLDNDGSPGGRLLLDGDRPVVNSDHSSWPARFHCVVPNAVDEPAPTVVYGHGLLGDRTEVDFFGGFASSGSVAACATDWLGMSAEDVPNLAGILGEMGRFGEQADRMLAGQVAFQLLGRLVNHPLGFAADEAFQNADGSPLLQVDGAVFVGNSQGGILGGAASAVSTEWSRAVLGVPGVNYSLLLPRSSDWPQFQTVFEAAYTDVDDRLMAIVLAQMLWDRGENAGYVQHLTSDPYPGRQPKTVLLVGAFGDHQVTNVATDVLARTIGARVHTPALEDGRATAVEPFWGIDPIESYPFDGSAYVMWDYGTPAPPSGPTPPFAPDYGRDPHGAGSSEPLVLAQAFGFLLDRTLIDVCSGPCRGTRIDG